MEWQGQPQKLSSPVRCRILCTHRNIILILEYFQVKQDLGTGYHFCSKKDEDFKLTWEKNKTRN